MDSYTSLQIHFSAYIKNCLVFVILGNMCKQEVFRALKQLIEQKEVVKQVNLDKGKKNQWVCLEGGSL